MAKRAKHLAAAAAFLAFGSAGASAQSVGARPGNDVGTGQSLPVSSNASNTTPDNTRSEIAPRLPAPGLPEGAPPAAYLHAARRAVAAGRSGEAQEALERAATRVLSRSVRPSRAGEPNASPLIQIIAEARGSVALGDRAQAIRLIDRALQDPEAVAPGP